MNSRWIMKTKNCIYGLLLLAAAALAACAKEEQPLPDRPEPGAEEPAVLGELLVKFVPEAGEALDRIAAETRSGEAATRSGILSVDDILASIGTTQIERVFPRSERTEAQTREEGLHLWYVIRFDARHSLEEVAARLKGVGELQCVTPNRTVKRAYNSKAMPISKAAYEAALAKRSRAAGRFSDPWLPLQWNLINDGTLFTEGAGGVKSIAGADVQCERAWELSTGDPSIVVAVLDEGVCLDHPDLKQNIWVNEDEIERSHADNDGNGYAGDYHGYNFVKNSGVITWDNVNDSGHGSHVAGVIAAVNDNGLGISSIAGGRGTLPGVKIMSCQIFSGSTSSNILATVRAIKYAADNGAVILQCSWGYPSGSANVYDWGEPGFASDEEWEEGAPLEKSTLDYFIHHAGSPNGPIDGGIAIFAGGNEYAPQAGYPGAAQLCVSVAATAADFTPAAYTNYGPGTDLSAPGGDQDYYYDYYGLCSFGPTLCPTDHARGEIGCILSTLPFTVSESGYGFMEGTSMACPHVSGVAALGLSYAAKLRKHFTAAEFKKLLIGTARPFADDIETLWPAKKTYYYYTTELGENTAKQLVLADYRGQMGAGQVDAFRLLQAVGDDANGCAVAFPNLYIPLEGTVTERPARYFAGGETLTYAVSIENAAVASCTAEGDRLLFRGLAEGVSKASIRASNGETHTFNITVRKNIGGNGWL